jgi:hypothetical protein
MNPSEEVSPVSNAASPPDPVTPERSYEEIAEVASHVYEVREGKEGDPVEDWLKAKAILDRRDRDAATEQPLVTHDDSGKLPETSGELRE